MPTLQQHFDRQPSRLDEELEPELGVRGLYFECNRDCLSTSIASCKCFQGEWHCETFHKCSICGLNHQGVAEGSVQICPTGKASVRASGWRRNAAGNDNVEAQQGASCRGQPPGREQHDRARGRAGLLIVEAVSLGQACQGGLRGAGDSDVHLRVLGRSDGAYDNGLACWDSDDLDLATLYRRHREFTIQDEGGASAAKAQFRRQLRGGQAAESFPWQKWHLAWDRPEKCCDKGRRDEHDCNVDGKRDTDWRSESGPPRCIQQLNLKLNRQVQRPSDRLLAIPACCWRRVCEGHAVCKNLDREIRFRNRSRDSDAHEHRAQLPPSKAREVGRQT
mmetsp:Transcript_86290/g.278641  ORF Transcript_86290/g.278641 Transcript_86290/m.278641 type:complete len:334 (+) Transcript_86290:3126-4127(+)